ncbi:Gypsy retrotransposon integrase-like protein 1 [Emydomyces testavorans]|uniref:Gypsy retrotransposon integrase-like protein 1 n=1 Tax=Emydomyces testavorans TaxID=2070801 RepID=A0AAF0IFV4_9EURO|nr:Gypsy retrotransposon integrase-like protein 1 [Emydomyces testavorans]
MASQDLATPSARTPDDKNGQSVIAEPNDLRSRESSSTISPSQPPESVDGRQAPDGDQAKLVIPLQKRRRVTRACDECRRKKIKCDGKQPCTHCTVYSYACTYDQPSNRRRNAAPQYIEALEARLQKAEAILRAILPKVDLDDPSLDCSNVEQFISTLEKNKCEIKPEPEPEPETKATCSSSEQCDESLLESMVENTGALDLDDQGYWDYHGQSSGLMFVRHLRKQFGNLVPERAPSKFQQISQRLEAAKSLSDSPIDTYMALAHDLPPRDIARRLCDNTLENACIVLRFMHKPTFNAMFNRIYDTPAEQYTNQENSFLPLLYLALAVGCLFRGVGDSTLDRSGYEPAVDQGFQYFKAGRLLLDITECRDLTSLQTICFMILFLQSSANVSTCYSYIGIALRASLRLGLHRSVSTNFNPVELETRKRVFWVVRSMDIHVSAILGLPWMLSEDDIDQELPLEIEDEYITTEGIRPVPPGTVSLMAGVNAHIRLTQILLKVTKYIYPVKAANLGSGRNYMVSHTKIREIERDLQAWKEDLLEAFKPGGDVPRDIDRLRQLLRISYAHVQMVMYRPFLHYVSASSQGQGIDKRSYACAAACVSVARNVVHITAEMKKKQLLNGSYWFTMYTTYFAILSLLFFILENPESATAKDGILKDALEGKNTLAGLAKRSMAADRCTQSLNVCINLHCLVRAFEANLRHKAIFKHLPERLRNRRGKAPAPVNRKRSQPTPSQPTAMPTLTGPVTPPSILKDMEALKRPHTFPIRVTTDVPKPFQPTVTQTTGSAANGNQTTPVQISNQSPVAVPHPVPMARPILDRETAQMSTPSSPLSASQQHQSTPLKHPVSFSPPFDNPHHLPDLMPMMFPSDDPFAYPNQPLSTLEDGQFKQDSLDVLRQFSYRAGHPISTTLETGTPTLTTAASSPGAFINGSSFSSVSNQDLSTVSGGASRPKGLNRYPTHHERRPSEPTPGSTGAGYVENPDLVTMPGQAFVWQGLPAQGGPGGDFFQHSVPEETFQNGAGDFGMPMDIGVAGFNALGMGMGVRTTLRYDHQFENVGIDSASEVNQEWAQWSGWNMGTAGEG